jgi:hypothetical protein
MGSLPDESFVPTDVVVVKANEHVQGEIRGELEFVQWSDVVNEPVSGLVFLVQMIVPDGVWIRDFDLVDSRGASSATTRGAIAWQRGTNASFTTSSSINDGETPAFFHLLSNAKLLWSQNAKCPRITPTVQPPPDSAPSPNRRDSGPGTPAVPSRS